MGWQAPLPEQVHRRLDGFTRRPKLALLEVHLGQPTPGLGQIEQVVAHVLVELRCLDGLQGLEPLANGQRRVFAHACDGAEDLVEQTQLFVGHGRFQA